ncbi:hypothetical protein [Tenacibaculum caenipelagi]|uniref:Uncharacterized protein n=1 Tax=Tenacibaculum caenipelagi TaxID=1325435 RepID=A0A4R6T9S0_9FLAO|nr:hypothetical protein [Tenacibaculum caenipelagi]TDQ22756.1 hypothetical protein DFQ07_2774 [Tenacibaculum caenipelagi]
MTTTQMAMAGYFDNTTWQDMVSNPVSGSGSYSTSTSAPIQTTTTNTSGSSGGNFWGGTNFMGLLSTIGGTAAQIIAAGKGQQVIVKDSSGNSKDIAPQLMQKLEQQAQANQTSVDSLVQMMQMQMIQSQQEKLKPKKDNTELYVGVGVGVLVLFGFGVFLVTQNKKKK